jgi:hypothetical protein
MRTVGLIGDGCRLQATLSSKCSSLFDQLGFQVQPQTVLDNHPLTNPARRSPVVK